MSRFSLRIPEQSFSDVDTEPKVRASFRYDKISIVDENNHAQQLAQARAKHRQRLIRPLHSNLKLKRVLANKTMNHNNSENSIRGNKSPDVPLIRAHEIDHILQTIKEVSQISAFQSKRMGLKCIHPQRPVQTENAYDTKILKDIYSPTSGRLSEGQKLRDKAISLCKKKAEYQEAIYKAKNRSLTNAKITPEKQEVIIKPCHKQLKSDIRFRYSSRRLLLLRTLSQIADKNPSSATLEKEDYGDETIYYRNTHGEDRRTSLTYTCLSPNRRQSYDNFKTDSTQTGIYLTETAEIPQVKSLANGISRPPLPQNNVQKIYKKLARKDSIMSNCSIMDKSAELNGNNGSEKESICGTLDSIKSKVLDQKVNPRVGDLPKTFPTLPTKSINSLTKLLPAVPVSHRQIESRSSLVKVHYKGYLHEGFGDNPSANIAKSNQDLIDCLNEMQKPVPVLRKNKSHKPVIKSKILQNGISSRNSLKEDIQNKSRYEDFSIRGLRRSVTGTQEETSKIHNLLTKIYKRSPKDKSKQEIQFETSLATIEREDTRNDTNESQAQWKLTMSKNFQEMTNASYQDTQEGSLEEETTSILTKYGYRDSITFREHRESVKPCKA